jgi:hypothetical protein
MNNGEPIFKPTKDAESQMALAACKALKAVQRGKEGQGLQELAAVSRWANAGGGRRQRKNLIPARVVPWGAGGQVWRG